METMDDVRFINQLVIRIFTAVRFTVKFLFVGQSLFEYEL